MSRLTDLLTYLLSAMGLTIFVVWPPSGPSAWFRERILRRILRGPFGMVLDCYICAGFWCGLLLAPLWWDLGHHHWWYWMGCLMVPSAFWVFHRYND